MPVDPATADSRAVARSGAALFALAPHVFFSFVGPDARRFLNGMFTNNIRALAPGQLNQSAMVDDKAKIQGLVDTWCLAPDTFLVGLEGVDPAFFQERYERYIVFDDVEMLEVESPDALLTLQGPRAAAVLVATGLPAPAAEGAFEVAAGVKVGRRSRSVDGGYDLLVPSVEREAMESRLVAAGAIPGGADLLDQLRVEVGHPRWPVDMGERSLPHELRLNERMCSFDKGCYIGQEVVNRIDVMGQVQKKLWGLVMAEVPPGGTSVRFEGNSVGHTLSGVLEPGSARVLAILRKVAWTPGVEVEVEGYGAAIVSDLPFRAPAPT